ncbi:MAG: hypothetical protein ABI954_11200 [Pyrinomonadaceae bacterium]
MKIQMQTELGTLFLLIAAVLISEAGVFGQTRQQLQQITVLAENASGDQFAFETQTQNGARVYAVNKPSAQMLAAIDQGLTDLFAVARKNSYKKHLNYADYTIFIARADRTKDSDGKYSPDFAIGAAQYAGTVFDKGGYVYAAGMVVALSPSAFVIAEHSKQFERVSDVVRYEGEHLVLYHNDRRRFNETRDHSKGGGHPILQ